MERQDQISLESFLKHTKEQYQIFSRGLYWTAADSLYLDDLMHANKVQAELKSRIAGTAASNALSQYIPSFLIYKAWQRTKAVYFFNNEIVNDIAQTEDTSLRVSLLERLPFRDMLFYFPKGMFSKQGDEDTAGIFVHMERHPEHLWIAFNYYDRKQNDLSLFFPGLYMALPITDDMKISQVFETPQYVKLSDYYKRTISLNNQLNEQEAEQRLLAERKTLNTAINLLYYLSSKNADIKPIKHAKKSHKNASAQRESKAPAIELHEVGAQYAEIIYRKLIDAPASTINSEDKTDIDNEVTTRKSTKAGGKRRPHVRKAHWQHYWTGHGRTTLEVRWKIDSFVGVNRDMQPTIVYDLNKKTLKGKQNPNTSKKKAKKQHN